jgi:F0F1-type ATP synthase membrane subunit b/b'
MPQLDRFAYVSEVIWLIVVFLVMYLVLLRYGLPRLYKVLRYRKDKLREISSEVGEVEKELYVLEQSVREVVSGSLRKMLGISERVNKLVEAEVEEISVGEREVLRKVREGVSSIEEGIMLDGLWVGGVVDECKYLKEGVVVNLKKKAWNL